ncbi:unnamed protein product [Blepharisma stoltei]|uniref:Alpha-1,4 glucan phosphorylase n=1 Tax=Blepharisma stoltei TaxID=1481888 RepID=A0AAU9IKV9_9CILI|nr:unnamed protein product [Blepharisma stoltei]
MANLCNLTCHKINGVSQIHTNLLKNLVFKDFNEYFPHKIINITNGVSPRRWIHCANNGLADIYNKYLDGSDWLADLSLLRNLDPKITDSKFQEEWSDIKFQNKVRLTKFILKETEIEVSPYSMFDVIIKRFHEYFCRQSNADLYCS